ncbi:MAG: NADH-quinone oxidoreductase subunit H [Candidatus Bathyarchaeota archaeon]|nr:NADH-quinone oxidoreductase subunit H [Candidatus Bathyarchaeota archaeon]
MTDLTLVLYGILNVAFTVMLAPLFISLIKKVKAFAQKRQGPPLLQTYRNLAKLFKKETVYSENSSWIMRITPLINIAALLVASLFVPMLVIPHPTDLVGNIILFIYLLALAKFFMALSGLDAGSTFGGMGSSREMAISALIEPTAIVVFAALAFAFKTTSIPEMFRGALTSTVLVDSVLIPICVSLFIVLIVESARVPVDNPETHLELTMVHEAMILEQSGKNLALMELSGAMKQLLLMGLLINVLVPWGLATEFSVVAILISLGAFMFKAIILAVIIGVFESSCAKSRFFRLPGLFALALFLSIITLILEVFA